MSFSCGIYKGSKTNDRQNITFVRRCFDTLGISVMTKDSSIEKMIVFYLNNINDTLNNNTEVSRFLKVSGRDDKSKKIYKISIYFQRDGSFSKTELFYFGAQIEIINNYRTIISSKILNDSSGCDGLYMGVSDYDCELKVSKDYRVIYKSRYRKNEPVIIDKSFINAVGGYDITIYNGIHTELHRLITKE